MLGTRVQVKRHRGQESPLPAGTQQDPTTREWSQFVHICYVNAFHDSELQSISDVIDRYYTVRELATEQARLGNHVLVLQLFHSKATLRQDSVEWRFLTPDLLTRGLGTLLGRSRRTAAAHFQPASELKRIIEFSRPDVVHFFGLTLDFNLRIVSKTCVRLGIPLVAQFNGGQPPEGRFRRAIQKGNLGRVDRALFTTVEHARPWLTNQLGLDDQRVIEFMETSSTFAWEPRLHSRSLTGMTGRPVFLWAGRLHPDKDPFTALKAFSQIVKYWPDAHLYLYYLDGELLPELQRYVVDIEELLGRVHFRGRASHAEMEAIYNSADVLLQASTREASGCTVLEAMSCGVIPAVTDIPSFRAMTDEGRYGILFPIGDWQSLAEQVLSMSLDELPDRSSRVRKHFEESLSFQALALQLRDLYAELISEKAGDLGEAAT